MAKQNFRKQLNSAFINKVIKPLELKVKKTALVIDNVLVKTTPVDTGRARSNWLVSLNAPKIEIVEPGILNDTTSILHKYSIDDKVYITNNVPYIRRLNDGYSVQAPAGFVEMAIQIGKNNM